MPTPSSILTKRNERLPHTSVAAVVVFGESRSPYIVFEEYRFTQFGFEHGSNRYIYPAGSAA